MLIGWIAVHGGCGRMDFDPLASGDAQLDAPLDAPIACVPAATPRYEQGSCSTTHGLPAMMSLTVATNMLAVRNLLVVAVDFDGTTNTVVVTDSLGNALQAVAPAPRSMTQSDQIWYAVITAGGPDVITATFDSPTLGIGLYAHEYSGLDTSGPLDVFVTGTGTGTAIATATLTTARPDELLFAHGMTQDVVSAPGAGFASRQTCNANMTEDMVAPTPGSYSATFTAGASANWLASLVALRPCP